LRLSFDNKTTAKQSSIGCLLGNRPKQKASALLRDVVAERFMLHGNS
jgi:hypothetical protein